MKILVGIILAAFISFVLNAQCHGDPGPQHVNTLPIWKGSPILLKVHSHGKLFQIGSENNKMKLLHVFGNMYEMGFAHGFLLREQLKNMTNIVWQYLESEFEGLIPKKVPNFLRKPLGGYFVGGALDLTYYITRAYTNTKYYEEMRGIADGSGVSLQLLKRIHMIGQLTKGTCSMFGAWGKATPNGKLLQLRSLDWDLDGPFSQFPLITVYHPSNKKYGNKWLNIGFYGWIGSISGVNEHKMGISEIGVYFNDESFGKQSRIVNPFTFILRDILQWDTTLTQSINRLQHAKRTCNLILGVGDGKQNQFRSFQYSHSVLTVINDNNLLPKNQTWHPQIENVVYYGMDWNCPPFHKRLSSLLNRYYGNITVENTIQYILPGLNSGNLQAVIYDLENQWVYYSFGTNDGHTKTDAYKRSYLGLDLKLLFAQTL